MTRPVRVPRVTLVLLSLALSAAAPDALIRMVPALTPAGAQAVLQEAERLAAKTGDPSAIAVVDADGALLAFARMDGVRPGSTDLSIGKARSAALMQRPTSELEENVASGRLGLATSGLTTLRGGVPLKVGTQTVGAVGIAGIRKEDDERNASAAALILDHAR